MLNFLTAAGRPSHVRTEPFNGGGEPGNNLRNDTYELRSARSCSGKWQRYRCHLNTVAILLQCCSLRESDMTLITIQWESH